MPVVNPQHLLEQAEMLSRTPGRKPRQADLRRSVSTAYYAVFHAILIAASDEFIGKTLRRDPRYTLVYRSLSHATIRKICEEASKKLRGPKFLKVSASVAFDEAIRLFANLTLTLQNKRHEADYDPSLYLTSADARLAISEARVAIAALEQSNFESRKLFVTLLAFPPR